MLWLVRFPDPLADCYGGSFDHVVFLKVTCLQIAASISLNDESLVSLVFSGVRIAASITLNGES